MSTAKPPTAIPISSVKASVVFKPGQLPKIDPANPSFVLDLGGVQIDASVNAKAARKLSTHPGGAVLQGRLIAEKGKLQLLDAGFSWIDAKPSTPDAAGVRDEQA